MRAVRHTFSPEAAVDELVEDDAIAGLAIVRGRARKLEASMREPLRIDVALNQVPGAGEPKTAVSAPHGLLPM